MATPKETDIFWDLKFTQFWDRTAFGKELDKDTDRLKEDLGKQSLKQESIDKAVWDEQSKLITDNNKEQKKNLKDSKDEIDSIHKTYEDNSAKRRLEAEGLVENQENAAGLQANISAAKATQWGKLSVWQMSSINKDITNQFAVSLNNAIKDNINFQSGLDDKLSSMGFSVVDKKRVIDELSKVLSDEEAQPLLDAIATKYATRSGFLQALWDTVKGIHDAQIKDSSADIQRSEGIERDTNAWKAMSSEEKARDIRDRFWPTWNVLTRSQKQEYINNAVSWNTTYGEMLDIISNYKDQSKQNKEERLVTLWKGTDDGWILDSSSVKGFDAWTSTSDKDYTGDKIEEEIVSTPIPESTPTDTTSPVPINSKDSKQSFTKWKLTYKNKKAYDIVRSYQYRLQQLFKTDPDKARKIAKLLKKKYVIS